MATNNSEIPMNLHPPGVDQLDGVRKITRAMEDLADRVSDQQTAPNRHGPVANKADRLPPQSRQPRFCRE
jgi:hypothetical protein